MSYVVVTAAKAKELAEKTLAFIKAEREKAVAAVVAERLAVLNGRWYRKLLRLEQLVEADVIAIERKLRFWDSKLQQAEDIFWKTEGLAKQILQAVEHGDVLHLKLDDAGQLVK